MPQAPALEPEPGWTEVHPFPFAAARRTFAAEGRAADLLSRRYFRREADGALVAKVWFGPRSEGAPGHVHGGGLLTALDEALGAACWMLGYPVMTARLNTVFRRPVPVGTTLLVETAVAHVRARALTVTGRILDRKGRVYVEGKGTFIRLSPAKVEQIFGIP
jgi:acyl-coenzyme A thioesterase PaaI-like protein